MLYMTIFNFNQRDNKLKLMNNKSEQYKIHLKLKNQKINQEGKKGKRAKQYIIC